MSPTHTQDVSHFISNRSFDGLQLWRVHGVGGADGGLGGQCRAKSHKLNTELASTMVFAAAIGGLLGARILFIFEEWQGFLAAPLRYIFTGAGFTWYGGFFGGAAAVSWVIKKNKIPRLVGADIGAPALALAYGAGRIGCHVAGDGDWGAVTDVPWGVAYTNAIVGWADPNSGVPYPPGVVVHPTPIYEFLQGLLVFGILWSLRKKGLAPGTSAWLYLILAACRASSSSSGVSILLSVSVSPKRNGLA